MPSPRAQGQIQKNYPCHVVVGIVGQMLRGPSRFPNNSHVWKRQMASFVSDRFPLTEHL